jgi:hypothetical protein
MSKYQFANIIPSIGDDFDISSEVEKDLDYDETRLLWSKRTFKCYLDDDREVEFKLLVQAEDLYGLCGDKSCEGQVDIEMLLVPLAKYCSEKTLKRANSDEGRQTDEQDLYDYGCYVVMGRELLKGVEGDTPLDTEVVENKIKAAVASFTAFGGMCGFYLDRYQNRIGNTGWDYLNEWVKDIDMAKVAIERWKAEKKTA